MSVTYHVLSPLVPSQILFHFPMGSEEASENIRSISSNNKEMENFSLQKDKYPRNLLERFITSDTQDSTTSEKIEEDVELNLGLSLGGRFGVDKDSANKLKRSSSIAGSIPLLREDDEVNTSQSVPYPTTLMRTSSLPTESEEEWRKRKNLQTLRRMQAMRRRSEKQRSSRDKMEENNKALHQGGRNFGEARSSSCALSLQDQGNREATGSSGTKTSEIGRTPVLVGETDGNKRKERGSAMEDMPCVSTKGEGPNGKRTDGILYKFGKGEEVRIMCVCHGEFLTPAEFVRHAGGGDVDNPLRHIVINPSSASLS